MCFLTYLKYKKKLNAKINLMRDFANELKSITLVMLTYVYVKKDYSFHFAGV